VSEVIDFRNYKVRYAQRHHSCYFCSDLITPGQKYYDAQRKKAHATCVVNAPTPELASTRWEVKVPLYLATEVERVMKLKGEKCTKTSVVREALIMWLVTWKVSHEETE
jgi:hypothetical protein